MNRIATIAVAALFATAAHAQGNRVSQSGTLVNVGSRLCAEVQYQSNADGVNVAQGDCRGGRADWEFVDLGNGEVAVRNRATGKVLDVSGAGRDDGANVQQYSWTGGANQRWRVDGSRPFRLVNVNSGKCLDVEKGSRDAGANILQWSCHGRENQSWTLERSSGVGQPGSQIGDRGFGRPGDNVNPGVVPGGKADSMCRGPAALRVQHQGRSTPLPCHGRGRGGAVRAHFTNLSDFQQRNAVKTFA